MSGGVEGRKENQESAKDPWIQSQISSLLYVSSHPPFQSLYFEFLILLLIILLLLFFLITLISAMAIILLLLLIIDCSSRPFSKTPRRFHLNRKLRKMHYIFLEIPTEKSTVVHWHLPYHSVYIIFSHKIWFKVQQK